MKQLAVLVVLLIVAMVQLPGAKEADPGRTESPGKTYQPIISERLNYQGVLTDAGGLAVPDGIYQLTFRLYDVQSGGSHIWEETNASVQVTKGIFNVVLGSNVALDLPFDDPYYLGISVEGEAELSPRIPLTAAPYAFTAKSVEGHDNIFPSSGLVGIGTRYPGFPLDIVGPSEMQVGMRYNGYNGLYSSIYVNAVMQTACPSIGYLREGLLRAMTLYDTDDHFRIRIGGSNHLSLSSTGYLGVGTGSVYPTERLDIDGALRLGTTGSNNTGTIRWTGSDFEGYNGSTWQSFTATGGSGLPAGSSGQTLRHNGSNWVAASNIYNSGSVIGINTTAPTADLHVGGTVDIGTDLYSGNLRIFRSSIPNPMVSASTSSDGGQLYFYDEASNITGALTADGNGEGGYFYVRRDPTFTAFQVDGNYNGSGSPVVSIFGGSNSTVFNMGVSGNSSVQLPANSVSSSEIENEAGVVSFTDGTGSYIIYSTITTIASQSITAPRAGYVLVLATFQGQLYHYTGTTSVAEFGVSDISSSLPDNQDVLLQISSGAGSGDYSMPITSTGLFEVDAGTHTFFCLGRTITGSFSVFDIQFTALFIPTAYGTVNPTLATGEGGSDDDGKVKEIKEAEVLNQRVASQAVNIARIEHELEEIKAQLEALNGKKESE